jgi:hypothetical protein
MDFKRCVDVGDRRLFAFCVFLIGGATMFKSKAAKGKPKASAHQEPAVAKTQTKSQSGPEQKVAKIDPKTNGRGDKHSPVARRQTPAAKHQERKLEKFHGLLQDFNHSSKGGIEGFLLHTDGQTVQVNVTADVGFAVVRGIGQNVEATVEVDSVAVKHGKGDHPVYNLVTLTGNDGKALIHSATGDAGVVTVQGIVKRINYDRHGAANGVVLESGDFIHLTPEGMKRIGLKAGDQVTAEGTASLMPLGQQVIEAKTVNGTSVLAKKPARAVSQRAK